LGSFWVWGGVVGCGGGVGVGVVGLIPPLRIVGS
jgi:hypothetical protein